MHRYGKTQLMQLQDKWIKNQLKLKQQDNTKDRRVLVMQNKDIFRKIVKVTLTQMSIVDKYAQASITEDIK